MVYSLDLPGKLEVTVHKAEGLANVQKLSAVFGEQDPYVAACLVNKRDDELVYTQEKPREQSLHSATKQAAASLLKYTKKLFIAEDSWVRTRAVAHGGANVEWEAVKTDTKGYDNRMRFKHPGRPKGSQMPVRLLLRVMDQEKVGLDREIGAAVIEVEALLKQEQPVECALDGDNGKVWLSFIFEPWAVSSQNGILQLKKVEACNLSKRVSSKLRNPSVLAEIFPWNLRSQTLPLKGKTSTETFSWDDTLTLHYSGLKGRKAAEGNLGLGLRLRLYGTTYLTVGQTRCLGEAWINPLPIIEAALLGSKEEGQESCVTTQRVDLHDSRFGITKCGELKFFASFTPQYDTEIADMSILLDETRNKRALLVGINYTGKESPLRGCHNDVYAIQELLQETYGCVSFMVLLDEASAIKPTASNIRKGLKWLLEESKPGEKLFFHYSGHGSQVPDLNGDEADGKDETLVPIDFDWERPETHITDDELKKQFHKLQDGSHLTVLFDCCHSGTLADLKLVDIPKSTRARSVVAEPPKDANNSGDVRSRFLRPCKRALEKIAELRLSRSNTSEQEPQTGKKAEANSTIEPAAADRGTDKPAKSSSIVVLSGCRDDQTAADACINSKYLGATTWSVVQVLSQDQQGISLQDFVGDVRYTIEKRGWKQVPQLSIKGKDNPITRNWLEGWSTSSRSRQGAGHPATPPNNQEEQGGLARSVLTQPAAKKPEPSLPVATDATKKPHSPLYRSDAVPSPSYKWNSEHIHRTLRAYSLAKRASPKSERSQEEERLRTNREADKPLKLGAKRITVKPTGRKKNAAKAGA